MTHNRILFLVAVPVSALAAIAIRWIIERYLWPVPSRGDRVQVRSGALVGQLGTVRRTDGRVVIVRLDGELEPMLFIASELRKVKP